MLTEQILKTIKYFDIQDRPVSLIDIYEYLFRGGEPLINLSEIQKSLKDLSDQVSEKSGFYFLKGRQVLVSKRLQNNFYAVPRLKKIVKYLKFARFIPFISAVAVSGSEALSNSKSGSDIDLLVFTHKNRMWLGRIMMTLFIHSLGLRRYGNKVKDRFCLNHYLVFDKIIDGDRNLYTAIEYSSLIPFYGAEIVYDFQQKNNFWIEKFILAPNFFLYSTPKPSNLKMLLEKSFDNFFGDFLERIAGKYQLRKIILQEHIVVSADELSFHPGSKGQQTLVKFAELKE